MSPLHLTLSIDSLEDESLVVRRFEKPSCLTEDGEK